MAELPQRFAVKVGGRTFFKLMQNGETILLYPGGAMEVRQSSNIHILLSQHEGIETR